MTPAPEGPEKDLEAIAGEVRVCTLCKLHQSRKNAVPGEGPAGADLMFIGEGPGFHENEQGRPFVGAAGRFLEELLAGIGLKREQVFIANVVKCRPPGNRDPEPEEMESCGPYLERQVRTVNPKVIVTLGRHSMARYFPNARISDIHGHARTIGGRTIVAMYHPAAALHQPSLRKVVAEDFARLPDLVAKARLAEAPGGRTEDSPQQLNLF
ncbi:MAG: uracil-DNA glycosylase [Anaerolineales bacterium]